MTKDQIKQLIADKIAGQGSAIDAASVLPAILDGIVDAIKDGPELPPINTKSFDGKKIPEALELLGLTEEQFNSLPEQMFIEDNSGFVSTRTFVRKKSETEWSVGFGASIGGDFGYGHVIERVNDSVNHILFEV